MAQESSSCDNQVQNLLSMGFKYDAVIKALKHAKSQEQAIEMLLNKATNAQQQKSIYDEDEYDDISECFVTGSDERRRIWHCSARKDEDIIKCIGQLRITYNYKFKPYRVQIGTGTVFAVDKKHNCYVITAAHNIRAAVYQCQNQLCQWNGKLSMKNTCDKCHNRGTKQKSTEKAEHVLFMRRSIEKQTYGDHEFEYECDLKETLFDQHLLEYEKFAHPKSGNDICILLINDKSAADYYRDKCKDIYLINNVTLFGNKSCQLHLFGYPGDKRDAETGCSEMWGMSTTKKKNNG
eukprot:304587_1